MDIKYVEKWRRTENLVQCVRGVLHAEDMVEILANEYEV